MDVMEIPISSMGQFLEEVLRPKPGFLTDFPWWRGQPQFCADLKTPAKLIPQIYRDRKYVEAAISYSFLRQAKIRHHNCPEDDNLAAWVYLMQHYRVPTKLLDWSNSPLVALFFALETTEKNECVIWCLDYISLSNFQSGMPAGMHGGITFSDVNLLRTMFKSCFHDKNSYNWDDGLEKAKNAIIAITPEYYEIRQLTQLSHFTIHMVDTPIEELPHSSSFLIKYIIKSDVRGQLIEDLDKFGVNVSTIFPDLENLSKHLKGINWRGSIEMQHAIMQDRQV